MQTPHLPAKVSSYAYSRRSVFSWRTIIAEGDVELLCKELLRLISRHHMVRTALVGQRQSPSAITLITLEDLTQDLYLLLLQKNRFNHYIDSQKTDEEIEKEIYQIELTNLLIGGLRRRRPENYRMARRISGVLETDPRFRKFKQPRDRKARYRQAAEVIYGLRDWEDGKSLKDNGTCQERITSIPMRRRNRRRTGCTGEAQVIVSNQELVELMVEIFEAIDSPAPLKVLRSLALSKLPVYDPVMNSIDDEFNEQRQGSHFLDSIAFTSESPEVLILRAEEEKLGRIAANHFLSQLSSLVRDNTARTEKVWRILWHIYFDPSEPSGQEIAEMVKMSDASVSDYRRKIEAEFNKVKISKNAIMAFSEELDEQLIWRLSLNEYIDRIRRINETQTDIEWMKTEVRRPGDIPAIVDLLQVM